MRISEIFHSIQGEGPHGGRPAVFLRLAGCNLRCVWCDTEYSWNWEKFDPKKETCNLTTEAAVEEMSRYPCKHLVITGGEPLVQQKELTPLALRMKRKGFFIEMETNGTLLPRPELDAFIDQYNCSPKLKNSGHTTAEKEKGRILKFFAASPKTIFKFVIAGPACYREVQTFMEKYAISKERVCLMPEGKNAAALDEKMRWLVPLSLERGIALTDRLHIRLFGARRAT